jgi:GNAT superfamily N-acetyltransferase
VTVVGDAAGAPGLTLRPATADELDACADIWRLSINDYVARLGQPEVPNEVAPLLRLYRHLHGTDPARFVVAHDGERPVAFASAVQREHLWFLSMCFVLPHLQGTGIGRRLLEATAPDPAAETARATATDSAQPISNGLYASLGMVPRMPLLNLIGLPTSVEPFGALPSGIRPVSFEEVVEGPSGDGHRRLETTINALDRELLGVIHPVDHRFLRMEGRQGWLYHGPDGAPIAYGYASEAGRVGPLATRDADLLAPILGHLMTAVVPRGAFALWLPGDADRAVVAALRTGMRLDQFPILLCWDRSFADFTRYLPISPGLL